MKAFLELTTSLASAISSLCLWCIAFRKVMYVVFFHVRLNYNMRAVGAPVCSPPLGGGKGGSRTR